MRPFRTNTILLRARLLLVAGVCIAPAAALPTVTHAAPAPQQGAAQLQDGEPGGRGREPAGATDYWDAIGGTDHGAQGRDK